MALDLRLALGVRLTLGLQVATGLHVAVGLRMVLDEVALGDVTFSPLQDIRAGANQCPLGMPNGTAMDLSPQRRISNRSSTTEHASSLLSRWPKA